MYPPRARFQVKAWTVPDPTYHPPEYTSDKVLSMPPWAHPPNPKDARSAISFHSPLQYDAAGRPLNPQGRTGIAGRGLLGKWGPNHAADPIVTRSTAHGTDVALIQRGDVGQWALPGGMVDANEEAIQTARREFQEEALGTVALDIADALDKAFANARIVFQGLVHDHRNTDHAWIESTAVHVALPTTLSTLKLVCDQDETLDAAWIPWKKQNKVIETLFPDHRLMISRALGEPL